MRVGGGFEWDACGSRVQGLAALWYPRVPCAVLCRYNLSQEDDDSGGFTMQQRKPEAIKRELEAKTKQASAKWRHRLALTLRVRWAVGHCRVTAC